MTTPTGNPAWVRGADYTQYGGHAEKANYQSQGVVNPRTDVGAEGFARLASDMAAVVRTAEFCVMQVTCASGPTPTMVDSCRLMTGTTAVAYLGTAPPAGFPSVTFVSDGYVYVTFDASYTDEYGVSGTFIANSPIATLINDTGGVAVPEPVDATTVRVRCFNLSAVAIAGARFTLTVGSGS